MSTVFPASRAILIDLDGTLADSAPDIAAAANRMLADFGAPPLPADKVRGFIGNGVPTLVRRVLAASPRLEHTDQQQALDAFYRHYSDCNGRHGALYPGVQQGLAILQGLGYRLACVTNKPQGYTLPLLDSMGLSAYFSAVVSGDSLPEMKPHPAPLLTACERLGVQADDCVMVGDSEVDVAAARAAGMPVYIVRYGYHGKAGLGALDCDAFIDSFVELPGLLCESRRKHPAGHAGQTIHNHDSRR